MSFLVEIKSFQEIDLICLQIPLHLLQAWRSRLPHTLLDHPVRCRKTFLFPRDDSRAIYIERINESRHSDTVAER